MESHDNIFFSLCNTISQLRSRNGCPWDQKQTIESLRKYMKEESEELIEAMGENDPSHLCEEIGDVLFHLILLSEISKESGHFTIDDVVKGINDKMIRRHPHVFADTPIGDEADLKKQWEKIKLLEKKKK